MFKKATIFTALLFILLASSPTNAAPVDNSSNLPELNPFCWHPKDCQKIRKQFGAEDEKTGFVSDASTAPCNTGTGDDQWGRCLPAGKSKTEISFGGKSEFSNIGEFLVVMYKYLLTIASIVAVVMIIIAGAQWTTSGGNSEAIGSAKKRIGGAIIGLFIAYMSYFVLNTINPALVNLRLPQVWMTKPISLMPEFCKDLKDVKGFMYAAASDDQVKTITLETADGNKDGYNRTTPTDFYCGERYFAENGGRGVCVGVRCSESGKACWDNAGYRKNYECGDVRIGGRIANSAAITNCHGALIRTADSFVDLATGAVSPWDCQPVKDVRLMPVCEKQEVLLPGGSGTGMLGKIASFSYVYNVGVHIEQAFSGPQFVQPIRLGALEFGTGHGEKENRYYVTILFSNIRSTADRLCGEGGTRGFVLKATMAADEWGENMAYKHYIGKGKGNGGVDLGGWWFWRYANKIDKQYLFTLDEIEKGGVRQDFDADDIALSSPIENYEKYFESQYVGRAKEFYGPIKDERLEIHSF